jgi:segregation and condensation protein A
MYKIKLPNFEGPFDLLLYFIKKDEINIYDIPIAKITDEFLKYIKVMQFIDLELAGEFLEMAATLIYIKLQMLLPQNQLAANGEVEDPRTQLVQRLIEYKQFKDAASELSNIAQTQKYVYYRNYFDNSINQIIPEEVEYKNATFFNLVNALKMALERNKKQDTPHLIGLLPVTIEEKILYITNLLKRLKRISFVKMVSNELVINIVVTFLAILELIKSNKIFIEQDALFEDIIISEYPKDLVKEEVLSFSNTN